MVSFTVPHEQWSVAMIDGLPAWVGLSSPVAATLVVFWLVFTGRLIVRASHTDVVRVLEKQITSLTTDRDSWKSSSERKGETISVLTKTNAELIETARTTQHVMSSLQESAGG
jgi:putative lipoic acid-binding regulatory protein